MRYSLLLPPVAVTLALAALFLSRLAFTEFRAWTSPGGHAWHRSSFLAVAGIVFGALATVLVLASRSL